MSTPSKSVNAWIYLSEDEPPGTTYKSSNSCYQTLLTYGVYNSTDMVSICWVDTLPTSATTVPTGNGSSCTIQLQPKTHNPGGIINQQYMDWIIADIRKANPNAKILIMLGYNPGELSRIFTKNQSQWQQNATDFANNLLAYLKHYDLDGFDVDWESPITDEITKQQFNMLFTAIRTAFSTQSRYYYLTLSPAEVGTLDGATINSAFDFVTLQLYSGFTYPSEFIKAGVSKSLLAYGAKFEPNNGIPYQTAQQAYQGYVSGGYSVATQWRLNSGDYQYEQAQQMIFHQLVWGPSGPAFNDTPTIGAAGNPLISQLVVRSGDVLDAVQATNSGVYVDGTHKTPVQYVLPQHGGNSGTASTAAIPSGDALVKVSGYTGTWYGWNCVLQITLTTRAGKTFGPYGTMAGATAKVPFTFTAPAGQSVLAFSGTTVNVPLAGGGTTDIIASLQANFG
jgi:hypothetical protein